MAAGPRSRSYHAEELRRDAKAQALGYRNRYEMRKLRERGVLPSAKAEKTDKAAARKASRMSAARRAGFMTDKEYYAARKEAKRWSDTHSRQAVSEYRPSMSPEEFGHYYYGMVAPWGVKRKPFDLRMRKTYIVDDRHHMTSDEYDEDPQY